MLNLRLKKPARRLSTRPLVKQSRKKQEESLQSEKPRGLLKKNASLLRENLKGSKICKKPKKKGKQKLKLSKNLKHWKRRWHPRKQKRNSKSV